MKDTGKKNNNTIIGESIDSDFKTVMLQEKISSNID